jgi:hypothetical protein
MIAAAGTGPVGGHLLHLIAGVVPLVVALVVVVFERLRATDSDEDYAARPAARALLTADSFGHGGRVPPASAARPARVRQRRARRPAALTLAAVGLLVAAGVHVTVMPQHFRESWLYGAFFLGTASAQVAAAALVWLHPSRWRLRAIAVASFGVVLLWAWTRVVGVPLGPGAGETESIGLLDVVASTAEVITAVGCVAAAARPTGLLPRRLRRASPA